ncbi:hypothetical protein MtrunA17_Chr7g0251701 [Medicago truncatula]|uniref:Uncharacterized protein n=1 Tax=Medicago truncatula TaxID=3880 RepID=A0A396H490_MEDTR|nr:hypothetical protein MtrunA17_Chr7g0251701 [Medicago truncatula]
MNSTCFEIVFLNSGTIPSGSPTFHSLLKVLGFLASGFVQLEEFYFQDYILFEIWHLI